MRRLLLSLFATLSTLPGWTAAGEFTVSSQADFDALNARLQKLIRAGERDIRVRFQPGTYFFGEQHIALMGLDYPDLSLSFEGEGVRLVGAGRDLIPTGSGRRVKAAFEGPFEISHGFVDLETGRNWDFRTEVRQAKRRPEVVDRAKGLCRVLTGESSLSAKDATSCRILLTQWYHSACYPVEKIEKGYVYFRSPKVTDDGSAVTDIDADYRYGHVLPRYILYNVKSDKVPYVRNGLVHLPGKMSLHECTASRVLTVSGCTLKSLTIRGLTFFGNAGDDCLMKLYRSRIGAISITGCTFEGIRGDCVVIQFTRGATLKDNLFRQCYRTCIDIGYESDRTTVSRCRFVDNGLALDNTGCIWNHASGTRITGNVFADFSYCAIGTGIHFSESISGKCSVLIEDNEIYQTAAFRKKPSRTLMDSGAIYVATIGQSQVIRNNYIHDIDGPYDNRGIFLDDGAVNAVVEGNLVVGIANSYCIDSRRTRWVETHPDTKIDRVNVNNSIGENTVDGRVRFETRGGDDGCRKGKNTVLKTGYDREKTLRTWKEAR